MGQDNFMAQPSEQNPIVAVQNRRLRQLA